MYILPDGCRARKRNYHPQPRHDPDEAGWDVGLIVAYWSTQSVNFQLSTIKLGYKALSLFAISVCPYVSNLAGPACDQTHILPTAMRYHYFSTKELRSVPVFTWQGGITRMECLWVCPVLAMQAHLDRTSSELYGHSDLVYPFRHVFMSQVPSKATSYHFLVEAQTCSEWMHMVMSHAGIDRKYKGGSIRGCSFGSY